MIHALPAMDKPSRAKQKIVTTFTAETPDLSEVLQLMEKGWTIHTTSSSVSISDHRQSIFTTFVLNAPAISSYEP